MQTRPTTFDICHFASIFMKCVVSDKKGILETSLEERGVLEKAKKERLNYVAGCNWRILSRDYRKEFNVQQRRLNYGNRIKQLLLNHSWITVYPNWWGVGSEEGSWQIRNWWIQTPKGTTKVWNTPRMLTRWQLFDFVHFITFFPAKSLVPQQLDLSHDINKV